MELFRKLKAVKAETQASAEAEMRRQVVNNVSDSVSPTATDAEIRRAVVHFLRRSGRPSDDILNELVAEIRVRMKRDAEAKASSDRRNAEIASVLTPNSTDAEIRAAVVQWHDERGDDSYKIGIRGRGTIADWIAKDVKNILKT